MKMTVVTDKQGNIVAAHHGEPLEPDVHAPHHESRASAGLIAGPDQELRVVDVPDNVAHIVNGHEFETHLKAALKKH
jgi:hypothetical protein